MSSFNLKLTYLLLTPYFYLKRYFIPLILYNSYAFWLSDKASISKGHLNLSTYLIHPLEISNFGSSKRTTKKVCEFVCVCVCVRWIFFEFWKSYSLFKVVKKFFKLADERISEVCLIWKEKQQILHHNMKPNIHICENYIVAF